MFLVFYNSQGQPESGPTGWMNLQMMDRWMDAWMDGCMDGWMDGWMDR